MCSTEDLRVTKKKPEKSYKEGSLSTYIANNRFNSKEYSRQSLTDYEFKRIKNLNSKTSGKNSILSKDDV